MTKCERCGKRLIMKPLWNYTMGLIGRFLLWLSNTVFPTYIDMCRNCAEIYVKSIDEILYPKEGNDTDWF